MIHSSGTRLPLPHVPLPDNFAIYTFPRQTDSAPTESHAPWRLQRICSDSHQALREARNLYHTNRYARIEVRRRYTDTETGILRDEPVQVLDTQKNKTQHHVTTVFLTVGVCIAVAAFLVLFR